MSRGLVAALAVMAWMVPSSSALAGEPRQLSAREVGALEGLSAECGELGLQRAGEARPDGLAPAPQPLAEEELASLQDLASENPALAEQSGGYLSGQDILVVIIIVWLCTLL